MLLQKGYVDIRYYSLISNYGYTFKDKKGKLHDLRFWANCYGASPNRWGCDIEEVEQAANDIEHKLYEQRHLRK